MSTLSGLKPYDLFSHYEALCGIPHGSGRTDRIVAYLKKFADDRLLECEIDRYNNVLIRKAASAGFEDAPGVILQAHHDMVWAEDEGLNFDFENSPIELVVDGDWIKAHGTTLGGDDGIGVAMMLAILDDDTLKTPALEMLFTADEEIGLIGALGFDCTRLKGKTLINLDSESEDVLICGCSGGVSLFSTIPEERTQATGTLISVRIGNLKGGHSGIEIDKGRGNAIVFMTRLLAAALEVTPATLASIKGGTRETAIAPHGSFEIVVDSEKSDEVKRVLSELSETIKAEYSSTDPGVTFEITSQNGVCVNAVTKADTAKSVSALLAIPYGIMAMSPDMKGLVQTSSNLGLIELKEEGLWFDNTVRSSLTSQKKWLSDKIRAIVAMAGGTTCAAEDYPGMKFNPDSVIKDRLIKAYDILYKKAPTVDAVHAGLEFGIFANRIKGLDCISIGPQMEGVHTSKEKLSISSSARTYEILRKTLELCC